jgi:inorganic pyrophosphatase
LVKEPSFPGCLIEVRPIGVLNMIDQDQSDQPL